MSILRVSPNMECIKSFWQVILNILNIESWFANHCARHWGGVNKVNKDVNRVNKDGALCLQGDINWKGTWGTIEHSDWEAVLFNLP